MKRLFFAVVLACFCLAMSARTHTVAKGENLKSIAEKYDVTLAQLLEANPGVESLFFVGMKLTVPENTTATETVTQRHNEAEQFKNEIVYIPADSDSESQTQTSSRVTANDFDHRFINYFADTKAFDKGYYGIGFYDYNDNGLGLTISVHGNWGIVDKGNMALKVGLSYGYPINESFMVNATVRMLDIFSHKFDDINWGAVITPGFTVKVNKFFIGAGFELGWIHDYGKVYTGIELGLGYKF